MSKKSKKKIGILSISMLVGITIFYNAGFTSVKQEQVYQDLKAKYATQETTQEVSETEEQNTESTEEVEEGAQDEPQSISYDGSTDTLVIEGVVWSYLTENGYTETQAASIIGNLYQESGLNPTRIEAGSGEGIGLVQWSFGRKQQLIDYANSKGVEWTDLYVQLEFLSNELKSSQFYEPYLSTFNNPYSINEATEAYCWGFERPSKAHANVEYRKSKAWEAYYRNANS